MPPALTVCNTDSLGEQIQREFADARVVKTLNTVNNIVDLGGIDTARGTEMYLAFWIRAMVALGTPHFNIHLARATPPGR